MPIKSLLLMICATSACAINPEPDDEASGAAGAGEGSSADDQNGQAASYPPLPQHGCGSPEVHVFAVYETPGGHAYVTVERPGNHELVLSAYEPTTWHVTPSQGVVIERVHLIGYHEQQLDLPSVPVSYDTYEQGGQAACGYSWPYNGQGCDTNELLAIARNRAMVEVTSFNGCYRASEWMMDANGQATANCDTAAGYEMYAFETCSQPTSEWVAEYF